jgi:hypothetical protein
MTQEPLTSSMGLGSLITGFCTSQAIYALVKLGIPDLLANGPMSSDDLAHSIGAHPQFVRRLLRALATVGVVRHLDDDTFDLSENGAQLRSGVPRSYAAFALFFGGEVYRAFGELTHTIRTGESSFETVFGMHFFDYLARNEEYETIFHALMRSGSEESQDPTELYDFTSHRIVVDVGGSHGAELARLLTRHAHLRGILLDLPYVAEQAREYFAAKGLAERTEVRSGDFFEAVPKGGDLYLLSSIIHDWDDERSVLILQNCRRAISADGTLLLIEAVAPPAAKLPRSRYGTSCLCRWAVSSGPRRNIESS